MAAATCAAARRVAVTRSLRVECAESAGVSFTCIFRRHRDVSWRASPLLRPDELLLSTSRKSSPNPERAGSQLDARGAGPEPRSRIRAVRFGRAVRRDGRRRRRRERRWGQRRARPPHASFVHLPPDVRHLRVARGAVGRGRGPRDAREARAAERRRRERVRGPVFGVGRRVLLRVGILLLHGRRTRRLRASSASASFRHLSRVSLEIEIERTRAARAAGLRRRRGP